MARRTGNLIRLIGAGMLLLCLALLTVPTLSAASITRAAATDVPGKFQIRAQGFRADEEVSVRLIGPSQQIIKLEREDANDRGQVRFNVRMPRHAQAGRWTITLRGVDSDKDADATFEMPRLPPNARLTVSQPSGPSGTAFTFIGAGFQTHELVSFWLTSPDGGQVEGGQALAGDGDQVVFSYTAPPGAQPGAWLMTVYGQASNNLGTVPFMVESEPEPPPSEQAG